METRVRFLFGRKCISDLWFRCVIGNSVSTECVQPLEFDLERGVALRIAWADGRRSAIPLAELRKACPCAGCRAERESASPHSLPVMASSAEQQRMVTVADIELVGRYALRVRWADGHDTGLYDYALLRRLGTLEG